MSELPEIPAPEGQSSERTDDIFTEILENNSCPFCHVSFEEKKEDQWLRTYDGRELWLEGVNTLVCPSCESVVYPDETIDLFEKARAGEIPGLKSRPYEPEEFEDDEDE